MMKKLIVQIEELEKAIHKKDLKDLNVSASGIGWHIEHSLLTLNLVIERLIQSDPTEYKPAFSFWKSFVLLFGKIPRGKIKAPKLVQPQENFSTETLSHHIIKTKSNLEKLRSAQPKQFFIHPMLGHFDRKGTIKFLGIHTGHHLKIIREIEKTH